MTLSERVEAVAGATPLCELSPMQRAELERELATASALEDLPGKWQAAVLEAEGAAHSCCSASARAAT
jgi:hypothetical protein